MTESSSSLQRRMRRLRLLPRLKRGIYKRYIRLVHKDNYFITRYFGAQFIVHWTDIVGREIALKNFEKIQLTYFIQACERLRPALFIDIGANCGLYPCILLGKGLVPKSILFEPDKRNAVFLRANLQINGMLNKSEIHDAAVSSRTGRIYLDPGGEKNIGTSRVVEDAKNNEAYEVDTVRLSDVIAIEGKTIAIKMDVEGHELAALAGMETLLRNNRGIIQIETTTTREKVIEQMRSFGYACTADFYSELVFEK